MMELKALVDAADSAREDAVAGSAFFVYEYHFDELAVVHNSVRHDPLEILAGKLRPIDDDGYGPVDSAPHDVLPVESLAVGPIEDDGYGPVDAALGEIVSEAQATTSNAISAAEEAGFLSFDAVHNETEAMGGDDGAGAEEADALAFETFIPLIADRQEEIVEEQNNEDSNSDDVLSNPTSEDEGGEERSAVDIDEDLYDEDDAFVLRDRALGNVEFQRAFTAKPVAESIELEDGRQFQVFVRCLAFCSPGEPPEVVVKLVPGVEGSPELVNDRRLELSVHLWSAVPGLNALRGNIAAAPMDASDAAALLQAGRRLRVIAAVRVSQRFWDMPLR